MSNNLYTKLRRACVYHADNNVRKQSTFSDKSQPYKHKNHQTGSTILGHLTTSVRICGCADSPQHQHFSGFPEFPHPRIRTFVENAVGGMADDGIFGSPSKYRQLEHFRLPPFRQWSKSKSRIQNSDFLLLFVEKQLVVRVCPNSEFWILFCTTPARYADR